MNNTQIAILKKLSEKHHVSGETIGAELNITRAAISKNIKILKKEYDINIVSNTNKGYKLTSKIDFLDLNKLISIFENVNYTYSTKSTSLDAMLAQQKYSSDAIFLSEHQTDGYGRFDRQWHSPFGKNIYLTMLEVIDLDISKISGLSLSVAVSIAKVIEKMGLNPEIKWPNDIYINDKKVCGIIINAFAELNGKVKVFIGIGLNVNMTENNSEYSFTSLKNEMQYHINRTSLLTEIIQTIRQDNLTFYKQGINSFIAHYNKINYLKNKLFDITISNKKYSNCTYQGINSSGEIIVKSDDDYTFSSGDISIVAK